MYFFEYHAKILQKYDEIIQVSVKTLFYSFKICIINEVFGFNYRFNREIFSCVFFTF